MLIGYSCCRSDFATPNWLVLPAPPRLSRTELAALANGVVACVQRAGRGRERERGGGGVRVTEMGEKETEYLRTNCHIWPLCVWVTDTAQGCLEGFISFDMSSTLCSSTFPFSVSVSFDCRHSGCHVSCFPQMTHVKLCPITVYQASSEQY